MKSPVYQTSIALTVEENSIVEQLRAKGFTMIHIFRMGLQALREKEGI